MMERIKKWWYNRIVKVTPPKNKQRYKEILEQISPLLEEYDHDRT